MHLDVLADISSDPQFSRLKFGLTITNLTKENRYFNQPFFKVNPKFDIKNGGQHDTFIMIPENFNSFPKKLEYGEPLFVTYEIKEGAYKMYQDILNKNNDTYIQAFANTTVGELYESDRFLIKKLFEHLKWLKQ